MTQKTYNYAQLCEAIEKAHGRITTPFSLRYPSDPRCEYCLRIHVGCDGWDMFWYKAEDADNIASLLGIDKDDLVGFRWDDWSETVLRIITRSDKE